MSGSKPLLLQQRPPISEADVGEKFFRLQSARNGRMLLREFDTPAHLQELSFLDQIKDCGRERNLSKGSQLHAFLLKGGFLTKDIRISTALLCMYAKCGALAKAEDVFDELSITDVAAWNALISAYVQNGLGHEALNCYQQMLNEGQSPDEVTFVCVLKACASIREAKRGEEVHAELHRQGLLKRNIFVATALIDMYGKCGVLERAQEAFDELPQQDLISWNALIAGYAQHGHGAKVLSCYEKLCKQGLSPNAVTYVCVLKACGAIRAADIGENIHVEIRKQGLLEKNLLLGTALVDMYAKCGALKKAKEVFAKLLGRDVALWNALISGYAQNELGEEVLNLFCQMQKENVLPDTVTYLSVLKACGTIGASRKGDEIHEEARKQQFMANSIELSNAMVDMYAKCGLLAKAQEVFDGISTRTISSWNTLIAGYAQVGDVERVFEILSLMIAEHVEPDEVTFSILLTACSHAGLLNMGQRFFENMSSVHHIVPTVDHHACMIDLLSRAGQSDKAVSIMNEVSTSDSLLLFSVLLNASQKGANLELRHRVFDCAQQLDHQFAGGYVYMSNICADSGMQM